jgi:hypothetical protein
MSDLLIKIRKNVDGSSVLTCVRADGSTTWQHQKGNQGQFFPHHDLTHFAVETALRQRAGFYGLVADGWNLQDFGNPWPRGPLPPDALIPELIVGFLDTERAASERWAAEQFHESAMRYFDAHDLSGSFRLTEDDLAQIRERRAALFARWDALPGGSTLELTFDRSEFPDA